MSKLPKWRTDPANAETSHRASRSEKLIRAAGGDVNIHLPLIESVKEIELRFPAEVASRVLCLVTVAAIASGELDTPVVKSWALGEAFSTHFSEREVHFMMDADDEHERVHMSWQIEAAVPLLWALGAPLKLEMMLQQTNPGAVLDNMPGFGQPTDAFVESSKLRAPADVLDEADLIYRVHWAARNEQLGGKPAPKDWQYGVIMERHKALNWLTCYEDQDWDDVGTDT
ncbi:MAG: DUF4272 domain-containing protein [Planctomycetes bacterium]|nr:DUF4272 domain-containing protein [Planctomycetota bacterium]